tara:strand:+ start:182 stop:922 length:741 start_codon:yes stop_codon:yes gene_type:complete
MSVSKIATLDNIFSVISDTDISNTDISNNDTNHISNTLNTQLCDNSNHDLNLLNQDVLSNGNVLSNKIALKQNELNKNSNSEESNVLNGLNVQNGLNEIDMSNELMKQNDMILSKIELNKTFQTQNYPSSNCMTDKQILSYENKKMIANKIKCFQKEEYLEILRIVDNYREKYSENKNGIFINLSKLKDQTVIDIHNFVEFCIKNRNKLDRDNKNRDDIKYKLGMDNTEAIYKPLPDTEHSELLSK